MTDERPPDDRSVGLRSRAEELLTVRGTKRAGDLEELSKAEILRLVHELDVHQVELEVQNEELRRAQSEVERSRAQYYDLYDLAPVGYFSIDETGKITTANLAAAALFGVPRSELVNRHLSAFVAPEEQDIYYRKRRLLFEDAREQNFELQFLRADGNRFWGLVEVSIAHDQDPDETPLGRVTISDVSQRKAADAALATLQRLDSIGVLAAGIAHDFNNILTSIHANLSLLAQDSGSTPSVELIGEAQSACRVAKGLAQKLLTFSAGGGPVQSTVNLVDLVTEAAGFAIRGSTARCVFEVQDPGPLVSADADQITLVVQNLVINAVQAMPQGGVISISIGRVKLGMDEHPVLGKGPYVVVRVQDQGGGIPAGKESRIFEPYFTTKSNGRGLGLATAYSVMKRHGGHIALTSEVGRSARFELHFPEKAAGASHGPSAVPVLEPVVQPGRSGNILIMDDEEAVLKALGRILRKLGYQTSMARSGAEALEAWRMAMETDKPFDLAIMDLTIPGGMGGKEAVTRLLFLEPGARAVASSGYSSDPVMSNGAAFGFVGVLPKPYTVQEVAHAVHGALKRDAKS